MGDEQVTHKKVRGQCDICRKMTWVLIQYLGTTPVAAYCKGCQPEEMI